MNIEKLKSGSLGFHATRDAVRERDKHTCQICGRAKRKGERQFDVHHMIDEDEGKDGAFKEKNDMAQMVTLCRKCHMNLPIVRRKMSEGGKKNHV